MENETNEINEATAPASEAPKAAKTKAPARLVRMANNEEVNFGVRKNLVPQINLEEGTIDFNIVTGQVITLSLFDNEHWQDVKNYSNLHQRALFAALRDRVKANSASTPVVDVAKKADEPGYFTLADTVEAQVKLLSEGKFNTRGEATEEDDLVLELQEQAFALTIITYGHMFLDAEKNVVKFGALEWSAENMTEAEVIKDIKEAWNVDLSRVQRNKIRKTAWFKAQLDMLKEQLGIVDKEEEVVL